MAHFVLLYQFNSACSDKSQDLDDHQASAETSGMTWLIALLLFLQISPSLQNLYFTEQHSGKTENDFFNVKGKHGRYLLRQPTNELKTLFGHSIAIFQDGGTPALLIGAPKYVNRGGVFTCSLKTSSCKTLSLETPDNTRNTSLTDYGFLGGSVAATSVEGNAILLFCDHLFAFPEGDKRPQPAGLCNLRKASGEGRTLHLKPCAAFGCLSGFSTAIRAASRNITEKPLLVAIGQPNMEQMHGGVVLSAVRPSLKQAAFKYLYQTPNKEANCTGLAVVFGFKFGIEALFVSDGSTSPKVEVFIAKQNSWVNEKKLFPPQIPGTILGRFGFALATADFAPGASQKQSSLLVGDPFFSLPEKNLTNAGAVFLFCRQKVEPSVVFVGPQSDGQFGYSLAIVGDVNSDGIPDFAVGCPYCNDGRGSVLVFPGQRDCSPSPPISVLREPHLRGFGWSLAAGEDFDKNGSPDLVIGAALSNAVVIVYSRPTLHGKCVRKNDCHLVEGIEKPCEMVFSFHLDFKDYIPLGKIEVG